MKVINEVAMNFIDNVDFNTQVNNVLAIIGESLNVCRIYIFLDSDDGSTTSNSHEWCNEGVIPQIDGLQNIDYKQFYSWKKTLDIHGKIIEHDINNLPEDIIEILRIQDIKSIVVFPIIVGNKQVGFVGIDECKRNRFWTEKEINLISTVTFMISSTYEKELEKNILKVYEKNFKSFINSVDGMLVISDSSGKIIYVNKVFARKICDGDKVLGENIFNNSVMVLEKENVYDIISKGNHYKGEVDISCDDKSFPGKIKMWIGEYNREKCIFTVIKDIKYEKELENKFGKIFQNNPAPMAITDTEEYRFIDVNEAFIDSLGYTREEVLGKRAKDIKIFKDSRSYDYILEEIGTKGSIQNISVKVKRADDSIMDGMIFGDITSSEGRPLFISVFIDISEQNALYQVVNNQKMRLENIIDSIRAGTWEWNLQTDQMVINDRWAEIIGYKVDELMPLSINTWRKFVQMDDYVEAQILLSQHFDHITDFYEAEFRMRHRSGTWIWVLSKGKVTQWSPDGKPLKMFGTHTDITELKLMQQKIKEVSIKDSLTGLYNRRYFIEILTNSLDEYSREKKNFSIAIVDIDHFKKVNDNYGHLCGDFVLKEFSDMLVDSLRSYDIVARYGGEEFIILCKNSSRENSVRILKRILISVSENIFTFDNQEIKITFSGGVADADEILNKGTTVENIIDLADKRMYGAKNSGRNMII